MSAFEKEYQREGPGDVRPGQSVQDTPSSISRSDAYLIDFNHMVFSDGNDFVDLVETDAICRCGADSVKREFLPDIGKPAIRVLRPPVYYSLANGIADNARINDALLGIGQSLGASVFGVAEPKYDRAAKEEIFRMAGQGAAGIVWSPRAQGVFADDGRMVDLCRFVHDHALISAIHCTPYSINESLVRIWHLARKSPEIPLIVFGAFASWENIQTLMQADLCPENVWYDLSGLAAERDLANVAAAIGTDRLLFGSGGDRFVAAILDALDRSPLDSDAKQAIRAGNAARLLGWQETRQ